MKTSHTDYKLNNRTPPCFECTNRIPTCHSKCDTYKEYEVLRLERKVTILKNKNHFLSVNAHQAEAIIKSKRRHSC